MKDVIAAEVKKLLQAVLGAPAYAADHAKGMADTVMTTVKAGIADPIKGATWAIAAVVAMDTFFGKAELIKGAFTAFSGLSGPAYALIGVGVLVWVARKS